MSADTNKKCIETWMRSYVENESYQSDVLSLYDNGEYWLTRTIQKFSSFSSYFIDPPERYTGFVDLQWDYHFVKDLETQEWILIE